MPRRKRHIPVTVVDRMPDVPTSTVLQQTVCATANPLQQAEAVIEAEYGMGNAVAAVVVVVKVGDLTSPTATRVK